MADDDVQVLRRQRDEAFRELERLRRIMVALDDRLGLRMDAGEATSCGEPPPDPAHPTAATQPAMAASAMTAQILALGRLWLQAQDATFSTFDEAFYRRQPDVDRAIVSGQFRSGFHHWLLHGAEEGRPAQFGEGGDLRQLSRLNRAVPTSRRFTLRNPFGGRSR